MGEWRPVVKGKSYEDADNVNSVFSVRPLFHVSVSRSGYVSVSVSGRLKCGLPIPRFSIWQTYLPIFILLLTVHT